MNAKKKRMGRPPIDNPANKVLPKIRVTQDKFSEYRQAAKSEGISFSEWVRNALDKAVKVTQRKKKAA